MRRMVAILAIFALLTGCVPADRSLPSTSFFAMNTRMSVEIDGDEGLLRDVEQLVYSLERKLSVTDEHSEIFAINRDGEGEVSAETAELIEFALDLCESTDGALDITIYPVLRAWGFTVDSDPDYEYRVLGDDEISELLPLVDYEKADISENTVTLDEGMMLDLGAVAKGYTSDRIADFLREKGVKSALLNLGGNIYALGSKPNGAKWTIGVADPINGGYLGTLEAADAAVVTSGGYERYFTVDGVDYCHIIDPSTGRPADSGLASVTVVGESGARCDALSTALFVMGLDRASEYWRAHGGFEAVFLTSDGELLITAGLEDNFVAQGEYGGTLPAVIG